MSVQLDKNSKTYTVRWYEKNTITGESIRRAKRGFTTRREARDFEEEMSNIREFASFSQLADLYYASLKGYANEETINKKKSLINMYAEDLKPYNVRNIKKSDLLTWKNSVAALDRSVNVKNKIIQVVKAISKFGFDYYDYPNFAISLKAFPKTSDDVKDIAIISPEDFNLIIENIDNEVYKRCFIFLYNTGMRRGEAMALLKSDIQGKYASINKNIKNFKQGFKPLKNVSSKRTILLNDLAYEAIEPLLETKGDFIFGELECLSITTIKRYFDNALMKAGLPHYRIHDLRHSFISNAILNGIDIVTVSKYVGHSDIERTLNTYSHLLKDSESRMIERLNEMNKNISWSTSLSEKAQF